MKYELSNGIITVGFTTLGGTLTSIKDAAGTEYLWQGDPAFWSGQAPVCFPICGSVRDNKAQSAKGPIALGRHGVIRKREFTFEEQTETSITFSMSYTEETKSEYPYNYKLYTHFELDGASVKATYKVQNNDDVVMPFFIGGHPGFNCPTEPGDTFEDYDVIFPEPQTLTKPFQEMGTGLMDINRQTTVLENGTTIPMNHGLFDNDAMALLGLTCRSAKLVSRKSGKGVQIDFPDYRYLLIWSCPGKEAPFVALEPWNGLSTDDNESDIFEEKMNLQTAAPGETKEYTHIITIL